MIRRLLSLGTLTLVLGAGLVGAGAVPAAAQPTASDGGGQLKIELDCDATPEEITITNRSNKEVEIEEIGSLFDRDKAEPYNTNETLKRGQSVTFESGEDANGGDKLTGRELFDDEANKEGAKVNTSIGTFKERC